MSIELILIVLLAISNIAITCYTHYHINNLLDIIIAIADRSNEVKIEKVHDRLGHRNIKVRIKKIKNEK